MTRTCTEPCTTSIKCFEINNLCTIYSGRNTFAWASARTARSPSTPTGVDGQYEHGNNMLSTGRKTAKFPGELASGYPGFLGTTGSKGVLHRVHRHPTPVTDTPRDPHLCRDALTSSRGNNRIIEQRGNRAGSAWPKQFHLPIIPGRKEGWGVQTSGEPERAEPICWSRALQDGRSPSSAIPYPTRGLDGQTRPEERIPSGSNRPKLPPVSPVPMAGEHISVQMPPIWPISCTMSVYEVAKASDRPTTPTWNQTDYLPGRHITAPSVQTTAGSLGGTDMPTIRGAGPHDKQEEVSPVTNTTSGVLGFPSVFNHSEVLDSQRETLEDTARCTSPPETDYNACEGTGEVYREDNSYTESNSNSPLTLQSFTEIDELSDTISPLPLRNDSKVQYTCPTLHKGKSRLDLVGGANLGGNGDDNPSSNTSTGTGIGHLQPGLGSHQWPGQDRWVVVSAGKNAPYKLPGAASNVSSDQDLCKGSEPLHYSLQVRQCHSSDLPESEGGSPLGTPLRPSSGDLGLVSYPGNNSNIRTSPGVRQFDSRPGVTIDSGLMRLDVESFSVPRYSTSAGTSGDRYVCISAYNSLTSVLQLAPRSGSGGDGCIHTELGSEQGLCQPTLVPNQPLPTPSVSAASKDGHGHTMVEHSTMVPSDPGNAGGLPQAPSQRTRPSDSTNRTGVRNVSRSSSSDCMAHLRDSFTSQGLSGEASELLLASWRDKTNKSYNSLCTKWFTWCQPRNRNPFDGPVADVVNFLAELHEQGYQYRSLNSYRSAISSIHNQVDGQPIGQHPLVSRVLKGAYHARPPQPRYNTFWDVGIVLRYIKSLGSNDSLSLCQLTLKTTMILGLWTCRGWISGRDLLPMREWFSDPFIFLNRAMHLSLLKIFSFHHLPRIYPCAQWRL